MARPGVLPEGVSVTPLTTHRDPRGGLAELLRSNAIQGPPPVQWIVSESERNAFRGVHVHVQHWDYLFVLQGEMLLGLHDLRPTSLTYHRSATMTLRGSDLRAVVIPPGVAHGFYYPERTLHLLGTSTYWDRRDDVACRWDAPELDIDWPCADPILSPRDRDAGGYAEMAAQFGRQ